MKPPSSLCAIGLSILAFGRAGAGETHVLPVSANLPQGPSWLLTRALGLQEQIPQPSQSTQPPSEPKKLPAQPQQPVEDAFAEAPTAGGEAPRGLNPRMIGDFPGTFVYRTITVPTVQITTLTLNIPQQGTDPVTGKPITIFKTVTIGSVQRATTVNTVTRVLAGGTGLGFKVADNQSPQPGDRAFFTYNYFGNIQGPSGPFASPQTVVQSTTVPAPGVGVSLPAGTTQTTTASTVIPGVTPPRQYLNGGVIGFEKTFLDGRASVGLRAPLYSQQGDGSFTQQSFGDLGVLFNYAIYLDRITGNVLSGGLMVTVPTGPAVDTSVGNVHSTALQPFFGYRWTKDRFYVMGFTSLAVPTDARDVTYLFNDVGLGYWIYRAAPDRLVSGIAPTVEAHISTPLNHRQFTDPVYGFNEVDLTAGFHVVLGRRSMVTLGVATPVTGPRPFNLEAIAQFNFSF